MSMLGNSNSPSSSGSSRSFSAGMLQRIVGHLPVAAADKENLLRRFFPVLSFDQRAGQGRDAVAFSGHLDEHPISLSTVQDVVGSGVLPDEEGKRDAVLQNAPLEFLETLLASSLSSP